MPTVIARLSTPTALQASAERMDEGLRVYRAQYCGVCHQLAVGGTTGQFGPSHNGMAWTAQRRLLDPTYTGSASTPDEYLHESILSPEVYIVDGYADSSHHMPSYAHLSSAEIDALVYLLGHQR
ncbi:MAG: c-type cytochrome [Caldilineaceae bacterium]|nr:c-type cytochrome [Caldilineaceae bacterium]